MFNLLIVDDEIYAVEGLKSGVKWSSIGFAHVYEAYNIHDAKNILHQTPIDLVICDIEMPEGDGFELLEWIRHNDSDLVTLFLTCHAEFHYAQRAIQLGTQDYLLKPVDFADLEKKVRKITDSIREEREWKAAQETAQSFWKTKKPMLVERFWQDVISSRISASIDQLRRTLQEFSIPFDPNEMNVLPILISIEQWTQALSERDEELMEYAIRKVAEEIILQGVEGCAVQDRNGVNVIFLYDSKAKRIGLDDLISRCENFIAYSQRNFYCKASCYIGESVGIERTKLGYDALLQMEYNNITKSHSIQLCRPKQEESGHYRAVDLSEFPDLIERGNEQELRQRIHESLTALKFEGGNAEALLIYYHSILQLIYSVLQQRGKSVREVFAETEVLEPTFVPKTISQMEDWAVRVIGAVGSYVKQDEDSIVQRVKAYIGAHLDERVERSGLAEMVHLNPAYLSRLFKKETGDSLSDYILSEKMKLTQKLLSSTSKPIAEIAQVAGYSNLSYFSKAFKKLFHVSPLAYRKGAK